MDPSQLVHLTGRDITLLGASLLVIYGGFKKWWVWGYQLIEEQTSHERTRRERDEWIEIARTGAYTIKSAVDLAAKK